MYFDFLYRYYWQSWKSEMGGETMEPFEMMDGGEIENLTALLYCKLATGSRLKKTDFRWKQY